MAIPPRALPLPGQKSPLDGKDLFGRLIALEAFVVAMAAQQMPPAGPAREAWAAEIRKDISARVREIGHPDLPSITDAYTDTLLAQAVKAAET